MYIYMYLVNNVDFFLRFIGLNCLTDVDECQYQNGGCLNRGKLRQNDSFIPVPNCFYEVGLIEIHPNVSYG